MKKSYTVAKGKKYARWIASQSIQNKKISINISDPVDFRSEINRYIEEKKLAELIKDKTMPKQDYTDRFVVEVYVASTDDIGGFDYESTFEFDTEKQAKSFIKVTEKSYFTCAEGTLKKMCFPLFSRKTKDKRLVFGHIAHCFSCGMCDCDCPQD